MKVATIDSLECYGCGGCVKSCEQKAIEMVENAESVYQFSAKVNEEKCTGCGNCVEMNSCAAISIKNV